MASQAATVSPLLQHVGAQHIITALARASQWRTVRLHPAVLGEGKAVEADAKELHPARKTLHITQISQHLAADLAGELCPGHHDGHSTRHTWRITHRSTLTSAKSGGPAACAGSAGDCIMTTAARASPRMPPQSMQRTAESRACVRPRHSTAWHGGAHVGALGLAVHEHVEAEALLDTDHLGDEALHAAVKLRLVDAAGLGRGARRADRGGLREAANSGGGEGGHLRSVVAADRGCPEARVSGDRTAGNAAASREHKVAASAAWWALFSSTAAQRCA